jgi:hypothetical protein
MGDCVVITCLNRLDNNDVAWEGFSTAFRRCPRFTSYELCNIFDIARVLLHLLCGCNKKPKRANEYDP